MSIGTDPNREVTFPSNMTCVGNGSTVQPQQWLSSSVRLGRDTAKSISNGMLSFL